MILSYNKQSPYYPPSEIYSDTYLLEVRVLEINYSLIVYYTILQNEKEENKNQILSAITGKL